MSTLFIPKCIVSLFADQIKEIHKKLLSEISQDYKIPLTELEQKYIFSFNVIPESEQKIDIIKRRSYNINLQESHRCIALNSKGLQCKRSKVSSRDLCAIHMSHNKYGTINNEQKPNPVKKKTLY